MTKADVERARAIRRRLEAFASEPPAGVVIDQVAHKVLGRLLSAPDSHLPLSTIVARAEHVPDRPSQGAVADGGALQSDIADRLVAACILSEHLRENFPAIVMRAREFEGKFKSLWQSVGEIREFLQRSSALNDLVDLRVLPFHAGDNKKDIQHAVITMNYVWSLLNKHHEISCRLELYLRTSRKSQALGAGKIAAMAVLAEQILDIAGCRRWADDLELVAVVLDDPDEPEDQTTLDQLRSAVRLRTARAVRL